jgi:hypothetical protein
MLLMQPQSSEFLHGQLVQSIKDINRRLESIDGRLSNLERRPNGNGHGSMRDRVYLVGGGGTVSGLVIGVVLAALKLLGG